MTLGDADFLFFFSFLLFISTFEVPGSRVS
jgi:hypothetical protein